MACRFVRSSAAQGLPFRPRARTGPQRSNMHSLWPANAVSKRFTLILADSQGTAVHGLTQRRTVVPTASFQGRSPSWTLPVFGPVMHGIHAFRKRPQPWYTDFLALAAVRRRP